MANFEFGRYGNRGVDVLGMALFQTLAQLGKAGGMAIQENRRKEEADSILKSIMEKKGFAVPGGKLMNPDGTLNPVEATTSYRSPAEVMANPENISALGNLANVDPNMFKVMSAMAQAQQPKTIELSRGAKAINVYPGGQTKTIAENPFEFPPSKESANEQTRLTRQQFVGKNGNYWEAVFNPIGGNTSYKDTGIPAPDKDAGTPKTPMASSADAKYITDAETLSRDLNEVQMGFNPSFVGPISGRIAQSISGPMGSISPQQARFNSTVAGIRNKFLNVLSGAAISPSEAERLMEQLPVVTDSPVVFQEKVSKTLQNVNFALQRYKQIRKLDGSTQPTVDVMGDPTQMDDSQLEEALRQLEGR